MKRSLVVVVADPRSVDGVPLGHPEGLSALGTFRDLNPWQPRGFICTSKSAVHLGFANVDGGFLGVFMD